MANVAFDPSLDFSLAQDLAGTFYVVQNNNWYFQNLQPVTTPIPGWKPVAKMKQILQLGAPLILPPSMFFANNGIMVIGQAPSSSATASFSATSGAGVTMTMSAATLLGTAADIGRVLTILDGGQYKYATITAQSSTTVATVTLTGTLSGTGPFANNTIWLSGTPTSNTTAFSVPLSNAYAQCWVSLPAGAIFAGSLAGTYLCKMATTTVGQVFQDQPIVTSGGISFPASPTPWSSTGPGAITQTSGAGVLCLAVAVPAFTISPTGRFAARMLFGYNNSAGNKTCGVSFGGTNFIQVTGSTTLQTGIMHDVVERSISASQVSQPASATGLGAGAAAPLGLTIDPTVAQNINLTVNVAAASDWGQFEYIVIEAYP